MTPTRSAHSLRHASFQRGPLQRGSLHRDLASPRKASIAAATTAFAVVATLILTAITGIAGASAAIVGYNLGAASTYAVLAGTALTGSGVNTLSGSGGTDLGVSPSLTMTAPDASIAGHGAINLGNAKAVAAQTDAYLAYLALRSAGPVTAIPGELGGTIIPPGIYTPDVTNAAITMSTSFTLDGQGHSDSVWVFTTNAAASTAASITMNLINGAEAANVYWAVGAAFSTGASATVAGHFIAASSIDLGAGSTINGQLLGLSLAPVTITPGTKIVNTMSSSAPATTWADQTLGAMRSGVPYSDGVTVVSGDGVPFSASAVDYQITGGVLPAGLALNQTTGVVSGTPITAGAASWSITARIQGHTSISTTFTMTVSPGVQPFVDLGTAETHAIIAATNVVNVGTTNLSGSAGTNVALGSGSIAGASLLNGVGTTNINNTASTAAHNDLVSAITYAKSLSATTLGAELGAATLTPGVYENTAALGLTGNLVLDAQGNNNGVFIIRTPAALVTAAASTVTLQNGAQACNVYWVVGAAVTVGANSSFSGHIMASSDVTIGDSTTVHGQALSATMAVVLANNTIINSACAPSGVFTIDGGAESTTADSTPTISGTSDADSGSPITVTVAGQTLSTTVTNGGTWAVTPTTLTGSTFAVTAKVRNLAGGSNSATQTLTLTPPLDTTAPTLTIAGGATKATGDPTPTIHGTSDAIGRTVTITVGGQTLSAVVDADGNWSATATVLSDGDQTVSASVSDAAGNTHTETQTLTVDTTAPTLTVAGGATKTTGDATPTISGTSDAIGRTVTITIGAGAGAQTLTATVDADGNWSVTAAALDSGAHEVLVSVSDAYGNTHASSQNLTVDTTAPTLTIEGGATKTTNDPTPTISGTSDAIGRTVTITIGAGAGAQTLTTTVDADGTWSVTAAALSSADHTVSARVRDAAGNTTTATQILTVDTADPTVDIRGGDSVATNNPAPLISGTSDAIGRTVTITVGGQTLSATVDADGEWSVTAATLTSGVHTVSAQVSDVAGNTATTTQALTVDTTAPTLSINGGATATTGSTTPTISGTSDAIGQTVTITIGEQILTTTVDANGNWSVTATELTVGEYSVSATVSDAVGNNRTAAQTLTIDTAAPTIGIDGGAERSTSTSTPIVSGTSNAIGRVVTLTIGAQTLTASVTSAGSWSVVAAALDRGVYPVHASVTDSFGRTVSAYQSLDYLSVRPTVIRNTTEAQTIRHGMRDTIVIAGDGFAPGERVQIWLHSTPVLLGTFTADSAGVIAGDVRDAAATPVGIHHVVLIGTASGTSENSRAITAITATDARAALASTGFAVGSILLVALLMLILGTTLLLRRAARRAAHQPRATN